ncbi:MAG: hypothetical protein ACI8T1_001070 [Verrucomicrobiales bacterium]|jgi:hypothetical protein
MNKRMLLVRRRTAIALLALIPGIAQADRNINFQSTFEAANTKSDGSAMDGSFEFEFGSFGDFQPTPESASTWSNHWTPTPNSNTSPISGSRVQYSTADVPFGGPANAFQGFVTLNTNDGGFEAGKQGYFWGFDDQSLSDTSEWVLLTNDAWKFPAIAVGEVELVDLNWKTRDPGTRTIVGAVNPDFDPDAAGAQAPHMSSVLAAQTAQVPEPEVIVLGWLGLALFMRRRR